MSNANDIIRIKYKEKEFLCLISLMCDCSIILIGNKINLEVEKKKRIIK